MMGKKDSGQVVVLGAGVMGSQIAALLACAGHAVRLLDLPAGDDPAGRAKEGIERALASRPPAFYTPEMAAGIEAGNIEDLECVAQADWVIEAVVEELEPKRALLARLEPYLHEDLVVSSNTSGLSIAELAHDRSSQFRRRFLGVHFFNPPRYMKLVEVIPGADTDPGIVASMVEFLGEALGKGVVRGRDTPNFIGNRMWIFAAADMLQRMDRDGLGVAAVDALTGVLMGRPKSATLRVCDLVGLDTVAHVAATSYNGLPDDPWRSTFALPDFYQRMLDEQMLGAKVNAGFYRKGEGGIEALDLERFTYGLVEEADLGPLAAAQRERQPLRRLSALWNDEGPLGKCGRAHLSAVLAYAADHAAEMAGDLVQIDQAMRWGFNWDLGPFEIWDGLGVKEVVAALEAQQLRVPDLVEQMLSAGNERFYGPDRVFSIATGKSEPLNRNPRRIELAPDRASWANEGGYLVELEGEVGALVFSGKMNALGPAALEAVHHAVDSAPFAGLVLCGAGDLFSVGADLKHMAGLVDREDWPALDAFVAGFQQAVRALRYAPFPVVAAVRGLALGGGCEFSLGADARVAAAELRMGLVETKVGLIPGSGGCMELARRHADAIDAAFATIFAGQFSDNAYQARAWGLLGAEDEIRIGDDLPLVRAAAKARELAEGPYAQEQEAVVQVTGDEGLALLNREIEGLLAAEKISDHDAVVGRGLARVLTGNGGAPRAMPESALLDLEREVFLELCGTAATRARIDHMLKTGKPLKN